MPLPSLHSQRLNLCLTPIHKIAQGCSKQIAVIKSWNRLSFRLLFVLWLGHSNRRISFNLNHTVVPLTACLGLMSYYRVNFASFKSFVSSDRFLDFAIHQSVRSSSCNWRVGSWNLNFVHLRCCVLGQQISPTLLTCGFQDRWHLCSAVWLLSTWMLQLVNDWLWYEVLWGPLD